MCMASQYRRGGRASSPGTAPMSQGQRMGWGALSARYVKSLLRNGGCAARPGLLTHPPGGLVWLPAALWLATTCPLAQAVPTKAIQDAVEYAARKFAADVGQESTETLTAKLTRLAARHGDEAVTAFRKVGPRALRLAEEAGEHANAAVRLMARHGDEALWVLENPQRMALFVKFGDDAAEAMVRHKGVATPLIERFHEPAARAIKAIDGQNARRVAMMAEDGSLAGIGSTDAILAVIEKYGNRAADFIWRNKGTLAVGVVLAAFLDDPQPFIEGTRDLATVAAAPVGETLRETARESARRTNWTAVWMTALVLVALLLVLRNLRRGRVRA